MPDVRGHPAKISSHPTFMPSFPLFLAGLLGLGGPELILIFAVLLLLFGGSRLPDLAKGLGKSIKEFKQAAREDTEPAKPRASAMSPVTCLSIGENPLAKANGEVRSQNSSDL